MELSEWLSKCKKFKQGGDGERPRQMSYFWLRGEDVYDEEGVEYEEVGDVCYAGITNVALEELYVWHPRLVTHIPYVNFLLNSKWVGHVFLTKDAEDGFENGFEINVDVGADLLRSALILLRSPFENVNVGRKFNKLKSMGFSDEEALYFGTIFRACDQQIQPSFMDHGIQINHSVFLGDIIEGKLYDKSPSAAIDCSPQYCLKALAKTEKDFITPIMEKHPNSVVEKTFGMSFSRIKNTQGNMKILIDLYKKEYGLG